QPRKQGFARQKSKDNTYRLDGQQYPDNPQQVILPDRRQNFDLRQCNEISAAAGVSAARVVESQCMLTRLIGCEGPGCAIMYRRVVGVDLKRPVIVFIDD